MLKCLLSIFLFIFTFSLQADQQPEFHGKIIVLWSGLGEYAWAKRLEVACNRLGWECITSFDSKQMSNFDKMVQKDPVTPDEIKTLIEKHQPDFVLNLKSDTIHSAKVCNYFSATGTLESVFDLKFSPPTKILAFDGILYCSRSINGLKLFFERHGKKFHGMEWYPSSPKTDYQPVSATRLFYCGFQWDNKRNGAEYRKLFSMLDKQGTLDIYGPASSWDCAPNSVKGFTFDEEEFRQAMRKSGIVLILHAQGNLDLGTPAARIFEASAASCVIISDRHPFVVQEFGDSILYVDHTQPGDILFQQIDAHRQWILTHPAEAEAMARKAHGIFVNKFTLEKQLQDLKTMHLNVLAEKIGKSKIDLKEPFL